MTGSEQMIKALAYLDDNVNTVYRLAEFKHNTKALSEQDIDSIKRTIKEMIVNFEYIISDRFKEAKQ